VWAPQLAVTEALSVEARLRVDRLLEVARESMAARGGRVGVGSTRSSRMLLSLQAAGVRARRYERDSALRGVVPADNGA
jgi:hypothetical protein